MKAPPCPSCSTECTEEDSSDRLELLERLAAGLAVADRAARGRAEQVVQARVGRAAVRAPEALRLELHQLRAPGHAWRRWGEAGLTELLAALRCDPVGRPRVVQDDLHLG